MTQRLTLTVEEAGKMLGICRNTAYKLANSGELPTIRLGRRRLVPIDKLNAIINPHIIDSPVWPEFVW